MDRAFLRSLDLGEGARLPEAAVEAILAEAAKQTAPQSGRVRFTVGFSGGEEGLTREQIMAIPDRKRRRAAIAQNIHLFGKEN